MKRTGVIAMAAATIFVSHCAQAQQLNQAIVFGDSTVDSGFYRALPNPGGGNSFNNNWAAAVGAGAGIPTSSPGLENSQVLAHYFGLTANPANQPAGTNYATSGSKNVLTNNAQTGGFQQAAPTVQQFARYLADVGGRANSNALYLINSGSNDVAFALGDSGTGPPPADPGAFLRSSAASLAAGVASLQAAGARYIIVAGQNYSFPQGGGAGNAQARQLRLEYMTALWSQMAPEGVNFIPADVNAVRLAIAADRGRFGFEFIDTNDQHTACTRPNPAVGNAYALLCSNQPGAPSNFANPTADQTRLFADAEGHLSTAGHKILADYYYSLVVAPSMMSMLAENAVKARATTVGTIQRQIDAAFRNRSGDGRANAWVTGDISHLEIDNYRGFPDDPSTPLSLAGGASYMIVPGVIVGAAVSIGKTTPTWSEGRGEFRQEEATGSLFAAYQGTSLWANTVATYGHLNYDMTRTVPIGITSFSSKGETNGTNWSVASQLGYDFGLGLLRTGPLAGVIWQRAEIDGFVETGGDFTSLGFERQARESAVGILGWRARLDLGIWQPFVQAVWNHELADTARSVTAYLTSIDAPHFSLPGVEVGKDWGTAAIGTTVDLGHGVMALGSVQSEFGDGSVKTWGGQLGLNVRF